MATKLKRVAAANVFLWGKQVGAVAWDEARGYASFEYADPFLRDGFDIAPITLPRRPGISSFPVLNSETFLGLPGLLADSLPDRFGNALIDLWLTRNGRSKENFSPIERLCYVGSRGMGALEFKPALVRQATTSVPVEIAELADLAQKILDKRADLLVNLNQEKAINTIIRIGTSAGGARPKALIAWNPTTHEVRSGQVTPLKGFEPWILKFDGIQDELLGDSQGYGRIEYAYHKMAVDAGISMTECRLFEEGGRAHFTTRRFDRSKDNEKVHMQSLCGLAHLDYRMAGAYGYEQAFNTIQQLNLGYPVLKEMFRRMAFNIVARNQDDHTRNIAFLMDQNGKWSLSPAFDVIWAYNPSGIWTNKHQMSVGGKRDNFTRSDLLQIAKQFGIREGDEILDGVVEVVKRWPEYASAAGVPSERIKEVGSTHRLSL